MSDGSLGSSVAGRKTQASSRRLLAARRSGVAESERQCAEFRKLSWPSAIRDTGVQLTADETFEVGRLIVEVIHGGSRNTHKSRKAWSLRRIQRDIVTGASFATLARCVQTYETCRQLGLQPPLGDVRAGHLLSLSHIGPAKQRSLLQKVDEQGLSVQQLRQSASRSGHTTRRRKPGLIKVLSLVRKYELLQDIDQVGSLPRAEVKKLGRQVAQLREELKQAEKQLRRFGSV